MNTPALRIKRVSKQYNLNGRPQATLKAVDEVTIDIEEGSMTGLVGKNGCGKSTLLKMIAGIVKPTTGTIEINGSLMAFTDFGAGYHPDLSGRENIFLVGGIYGLAKNEIEQLLHEIVAFSELDKFLDVPVKNYSQGMFLRLAFSMMIHLPLKIVLLDEALAVGDEAFRQKCYERIRTWAEAGRTIILVSHSFEEIASLCNQCIVMENGKVIAQGKPDEVYNTYVESINSDHASETSIPEGIESKFKILKPGYIKILSVTVGNGDDGKNEMDFTQPFVVSITWQKLTSEGTVYFDLVLSDKMDMPFFSTSNYYGKKIDHFQEENYGKKGEFVSKCYIQPLFLNHGSVKVRINATIFFNKGNHFSLVLVKKPLTVLIKNPVNYSDDFFWFDSPAPIRTTMHWEEFNRN